MGDSGPVYLSELSSVTYGLGCFYEQRARDIHASYPEDGTVTIISRHFHENTEHARVFYPIGTEWVSAEPRPATYEEVQHGVLAALVQLDRIDSSVRSKP